MVYNRQIMGGRPRLFRLDRDLGETTDLATEHPERLGEMLKRASVWESGLIEPLWGKGSR
jgi:hypothetical protein